MAHGPQFLACSFTPALEGPPGPEVDLSGCEARQGAVAAEGLQAAGDEDALGLARPQCGLHLKCHVGPTDSTEAAPGTILLGDFSFHISRNSIPASKSVEGAQRKTQLWFQSSDLVD